MPLKDNETQTPLGTYEVLDKAGRVYRIESDNWAGDPGLVVFTLRKIMTGFFTEVSSCVRVTKGNFFDVVLMNGSEVITTLGPLDLDESINQCFEMSENLSVVDSKSRYFIRRHTPEVK